MQRNLLVNGAVVLLALASLLAVWLTRHEPTTAELAARKDKLLERFREEAVTRIVLVRDGKRLELVRSPQDEEFRIQEPWREPADVASTSTLLRDLERASALRKADVSAKQAGLSPPRLEIQLEMEDEQASLALGGPAPSPAGARYVEVKAAGQPEQLYTVSQELAQSLELPWDRFREKRLLGYGRSDLARIELQTPQGALVLSQPQLGVFFYEHDGKRELAARAATDQVLGALSRLSTETFVELPAARAALGADALQAQLRLREQKGDVTVQLGGACPADPARAVALVATPGAEARAGCVPRELQDWLSPSPESLLSLRAFSANPDEVEELTLRRGPERLELARKGSRFVLRAPHAGEIALDAGNQRLAALLQASGRLATQPRAALGLEPPAGTARIALSAASQADARVEQVLLGRTRADGSLCVERELDAVRLCFDAEAAQAFDTDASLLEPLELLSFSPSELAELDVLRGAVEQRLERGEDGGLRLTRPQGFQHDGALVSELLQTLGSLHAQRWLASAPRPSDGLDQPRLRLSFSLSSDAGGERQQLSIGAPTPGGFAARLSSKPGVFELSRADVSKLDLLLVDRGLSPFPEPELQEIELQAGGRRALLSRREGIWRSGSLTDPRARELAEALSGLRAQGTAHLGAARASEGFSKPSLTLRFRDRQGEERKVLVGAPTTVDGEELAFSRREGVDATFLLSRSLVEDLQGF